MAHNSKLTTRNLKVGLLGGSFNPAHAGHRYISVEAMKRLGLTQVWWLVSPANPLKDKKSLADYETRLELAKQAAQHPRIKVSDAERCFGTTFTIDTLRRLKQHYPYVQFVWLMGADNLLTFPRWKQWRQIAQEVEIAVFDRKPYTHRAVRGKAAVALKGVRDRGSGIREKDDYFLENFRPYGKTNNLPLKYFAEQKIRRMMGTGSTLIPDPRSQTPSLTYLFLPPNHCSATVLRKTLGKGAFMRHNVGGINS